MLLAFLLHLWLKYAAINQGYFMTRQLFSPSNEPDLVLSDKLPKVELHVHNKGTITHELASELAKRHEVKLPAGLFNKDGKYQFSDFLDFLKKYDQVAALVRTPQDVGDVVYDYLKRCHAQGAIYVEITCSPYHARTVGLSYEQFVNALALAIDRAQQAFGIESRLLMTFLRHETAERNQEVLEDILAYRHPYVVGINLAGDEAQPLDAFVPLYRRAREAGLKCTAHIGEHCNAKEMRLAISQLQPTRIGHGIHCQNDDALIDFLKENNIGIEVCPGSNIALGLTKSRQDHPFKKLYQRGLLVSLNSDDPPFFATSIGDEYDQARCAWKMSDQDLLEITRRAMKSAFCHPALAKKCESQIKLFVAWRTFRDLLLRNSSHYRFNEVNRFSLQYQQRPSTSHVFELHRSVIASFDPWSDLVEVSSNLLSAHQQFKLDKSSSHTVNDRALQAFMNCQSHKAPMMPRATP